MIQSLDNVLPQQPPMRLLDAVIEVNHELAHCKTTITKENIFYHSDAEGIYAWVGMELMAQTAAVFASHQGKGDMPAMGFLLSVRKFSSDRPIFKLGETLEILAKKIYLEDNIGCFDCTIKLNHQVVATGKLNAFQPDKDHAAAILRGE